MPPDPCAKQHRSLKGLWWVLEILPKAAKWREWRTWSLLGWYLPFGEPRRIETGAKTHSSVRQRQLCPDLTYKPVNLPPRPPLPPIGWLTQVLYWITSTLTLIAVAAGMAWVVYKLGRLILGWLF